MSKPLILVSNDDGITSRGIRFLVDIMKKIGEVVVVAPDRPQSGMGHAITIDETLRLEEEDLIDDVKAYKCSGTPADCVKLAKHYILNDRRPNLVVSGINHGANTSISILYRVPCRQRWKQLSRVCRRLAFHYVTIHLTRTLRMLKNMWSQLQNRF